MILSNGRKSLANFTSFANVSSLISGQRNAGPKKGLSPR